MPKVQHISISLRMFGNGLNPDEVSNLLEASSADKTLINNSITSNVTLVRNESAGKWIRSFTRRSVDDIDFHIVKLLSYFTNDLDVWCKLTSQFRADLFCGIFLHEENEGISLKPSTLHAVSSRNLLLDFDVYGLKLWYSDTPIEVRL